eukprot:7145534-Pyramimonas_sp.AAC.1
MEAGALPLGDITVDKYNMLDHVLCGAVVLGSMRSLRRHRQAALSTCHYLVTVDIVHSHYVSPVSRALPRD